MGSGPGFGPPGSGSADGNTGLPSDQDLNASPLAANLVGGGDGRRGRKRSGDGYSRFVAWMKVVLPFLALALVALIIIWPKLKTEDTFRIGFSSVRLSGTSEPGVDNARYVGTDENRQPYSITADLARVEGEGLYNLELPKADLTLEDGTWLVLTAQTGRFIQDRQQLELHGGVNLFHDTGYEISTEELTMDLSRNSAESATPVAGHGPFGELKSAGLKLVDKGKIIYFTGPAHLVLFPAGSGQTQQDQSGAR